ncbi:MAG: HlyC/CorC family transporter [Chloroflexi bacterium]|nr:HlyC/CorC family transporter [Chloroflexota bacterium]
METDGWLGLSLLLLSLTCTTFAVVAEAAIAAVPRVRRGMNGEGSPWVRALEWVQSRRSLLLVTLLALKTGGSVFTVAALGRLLYPMLEVSWWSTLGIAALALLLLLLFQAVPQALAVRVPLRAFRIVLAPLRLAHLLLTPLSALYDGMARLAVGLVWRGRAVAVPREEEEELEAIVEEIGEESGELEDQEREMIRGIIEMETTSARELMVPRIDIVAVEADASLEEATAKVVLHGFSRLPIYDETLDNIVGVVYAKDLLRAMSGAEVRPALRDLARTPHFIPETKKIDELLKEFKEQRVHMAIVVDEYGGTAGLVSLEDLIEEIVGEIEDEYDRGEDTIDRVSQHEAVLDARVSIDDLNELFGTEIAPQDFDTVGGLVYAQLGRIPAVGDQVRVDGLTISVLSTLGRRIKKVRAVQQAGPEAAAG